MPPVDLAGSKMPATARRSPPAGRSTLPATPGSPPPGRPAPGARDPALDNYTGNVSPPAQEGRRQRWSNRALLWDLSTNKRVQKCGRVRVQNTVDVRQGPDGRTHYSGLMLCGNVWGCPCCSYKIALGRAGELKQLLELNAERGGSAVFQTFTIRHSWTSDLRGMAKTVSRSFRQLLQGKAYQVLKARLQILGQVRTLETTVGRNGFHPHAHALFISSRQLTPAEVQELGERNAQLWVRALEKAGLDALHAFQPAELVQSAGVGGYLVKMGMALELAGAGKIGKRGSRTPWQVLQDFRDTGDMADLKLWRVYERGMRGLKQLTWTPGLKRSFGIGDPSDQELADAEVDGSQTLLEIEGSVWSQITRVAGGPARILDAAEAGGAELAERVALQVCRQFWKGDRLPMQVALGIRTRLPAVA
jgi:hypothetical protein